MPGLTFPARNLEDATRALDPNHTLNLNDPVDAPLFVDRRSSALKKARKLLQGQSCTKLLFSGSRGNGKSTELSRLEHDLQDQFWIIRFSARDKLDIADLNYVDILVSVPLQLIKKAADEELEISGNTMTRARMFQRDVSIDRTEAESAGVEVKVGLKEVFLNLFAFEGKLARESATRKTVRESIEHKLSDLNALVEQLVDDIQKQTGKTVLIIIEDIDKADIKTSIELFYDHGMSLSGIPACMIYTFPLALQHDQHCTQIANYFSKQITLENFKTHKRNDDPDIEGLSLLGQLLDRRVDAALFAQDARNLIVSHSGGVPRLLIQLARDAVLEADIDEQSTVLATHATAAIRDYRATFARMLSQSQLESLKEIRASKDVDPGKPEHLQLLHNLSVLEYENGGENKVWYDVNPVVIELLN